MKYSWLGIDPGAGGALAILTADGAVDVTDMPTHVINDKRRVDLHALLRLLRSWDMAYGIAHAYIENVSAMPGQSPNGMFQFGFACGAVQMAVAAVDIPMRLITPQVWKKHYGLVGGRENKDQSRQVASRLFPQYACHWARKKDDGRAEAVLIANYGRIQ